MMPENVKKELERIVASLNQVSVCGEQNMARFVLALQALGRILEEGEADGECNASV